MISFDKMGIYIAVPTCPALVLRSVRQSDLEYLRQWKNQQKQFFFFQKEITVNQQKQWYESFKQRPHDLMFITEYREKVFGCMGIRWLENHWDIYNVILGLQEFGGRGLMGSAFATMINLAGSLNEGPISLKVLRHNPAVKWYQNWGFQITESDDSFFSMIFHSQKPRRL